MNERSWRGDSGWLKDALIVGAASLFVALCVFLLMQSWAENLPPAPGEKSHYDHLRERGIG